MSAPALYVSRPKTRVATLTIHIRFLKIRVAVKVEVKEKMPNFLRGVRFWCPRILPPYRDLSATKRHDAKNWGDLFVNVK